MTRTPNPLEWLEPPGDGLHALRARIRRRRRAAAAGGSALALAVVIGVATVGQRDDGAATGTESLRLASADLPKVRVLNGAALEVSPPDAGSRIYLVATHGNDQATSR